VVPIGINYPQPPERGWLSPWGTMVLRIGAPLHFDAEVAVARKIAGDHTLSPGKKKRRSMLLTARITHHLMEALARLSGKRYPYLAPEALP
jgi:hypothetical protein